MPTMTQQSLFGLNPDRVKPRHDEWTTLRMLVTASTAPQPCDRYGETVCVAGLRLDLDDPGWVRLYPVNFRDLELGRRFKKYDIMTVRARPNHSDARVESWQPLPETVAVERHLKAWSQRRPHVEPFVEDSMCDLLAAVRDTPPARSLAAVRPADVGELIVEPHPGWSLAEQQEIDAYVHRLGLENAPRAALEAPRFRAFCRYRCHSRRCKGHRQAVLDWELLALQRRLAQRGGAAEELRRRFLAELYGSAREVVFYVGNQARRPHAFSVLGVYNPPR
jgi:hypothetical protein